MALGTRRAKPGGRETPGEIRRVEEHRREEAARRLVEASGRRGPEAGREFLDAARRHGIDLDRMWASFGPGGAVGEVCLAVAGAGRTCTFFTSTPRTAGGERELGRVVDAACGNMESMGLAQALLLPNEEGARRAFESGGFRFLAELLYLRRKTPGPDSEEGAAPEEIDWPEGVSVANWRPGEEAELKTALRRSYEQTLDCPDLCGMRTLDDVLDSHRSTGVLDPSLWWIVRLEGEPEGALLLSRCPDQGSVELVYLGLSPALRGKGLGRAMLRMGLGRLSRVPEQHVTCAVDARNTPALRLYRSFGFADIGKRIALVRALNGGPGVGA